MPSHPLAIAHRCSAKTLLERRSSFPKETMPLSPHSVTERSYGSALEWRGYNVISLKWPMPNPRVLQAGPATLAHARSPCSGVARIHRFAAQGWVAGRCVGLRRRTGRCINASGLEETSMVRRKRNGSKLRRVSVIALARAQAHRLTVEGRCSSRHPAGNDALDVRTPGPLTRQGCGATST